MKPGSGTAATSTTTNSTIKSYLNSTWLNLIDANIRNQIKQVKIPYRPGSGTSMTVNSGSNGLSCKVFLLSNIEMGGQTDWSYMPHDGAKLAYFEYGTGTASANNKRIAYLNGTATYWWSRSPYTYNSTNAWCCSSNGNCSSTSNCSNTYGVRPALTETTRPSRPIGPKQCPVKGGCIPSKAQQAADKHMALTLTAE